MGEGKVYVGRGVELREGTCFEVRRITNQGGNQARKGGEGRGEEASAWGRVDPERQRRDGARNVIFRVLTFERVWRTVMISVVEVQYWTHRGCQ